MSVRWIGAQRDVLGGDVDGKISLRELGDLTHLYGLGPRAGVSGEITVFDGQPCIARVVDRRVNVETSADGHAACFLVYDQVHAWHEVVQLRSINDEATLLATVRRVARESGLDDGVPFIFLLHGYAASITFHVLDKRDDLPHTPALHERAKVRFELERRVVDVLGFHSSRHRGIFTPGESDLHMHFRTVDGQVSGHVERIALEPGTAVAVPRRE
jgi:hypothetical protein